jgi:hypothetical protein
MIPALANEDRIPHERAVWREGKPPASAEGFRQICVDYGNGQIERTLIDQASWSLVRRWRFGWPPA